MRDGEWSVSQREGQVQSAFAKSNQADFEFEFSNASECYDVSGERIVTEISFRIFDETKEIYKYAVLPMYVRGKSQAYWENVISPYSAHAGSGQIRIATSLSGESGWDKWNDVLVKPTLNFVDRNTMKEGSFIGLHRHVANQEMYFIETGEAVMLNGVSQVKGDAYETIRRWDENPANTRRVKEFYAQGGWIERRVLRAGEVSVIVPKSSDTGSVYFHGIKAQKDTVFWTMGTKN